MGGGGEKSAGYSVSHPKKIYDCRLSTILCCIHLYTTSVSYTSYGAAWTQRSSSRSEQWVCVHSLMLSLAWKWIRWCWNQRRTCLATNGLWKVNMLPNTTLPYLLDFKLGHIISAAPDKHSVISFAFSHGKSSVWSQIQRCTGWNFEWKSWREPPPSNPGNATVFSYPKAIVSADRWWQLLVNNPLSEQVVAIVIDEVHCVYKWWGRISKLNSVWLAIKCQ